MIEPRDEWPLFVFSCICGGVCFLGGAILKLTGIEDNAWRDLALLSSAFPIASLLGWLINRIPAVARSNEEQRRSHRRVGLARWRRQLQSGHCDRCGARLYRAHRAGAKGDDLICCENQYNGHLLGLAGTGRCVNIADLGLLNAVAKDCGEKPLDPL